MIWQELKNAKRLQSYCKINLWPQRLQRISLLRWSHRSRTGRSLCKKQTGQSHSLVRQHNTHACLFVSRFLLDRSPEMICMANINSRHYLCTVSPGSNAVTCLGAASLQVCSTSTDEGLAFEQSNSYFPRRINLNDLVNQTIYLDQHTQTE